MDLAAAGVSLQLSRSDAVLAWLAGMAWNATCGTRCCGNRDREQDRPGSQHRVPATRMAECSCQDCPPPGL